MDANYDKVLLKGEVFQRYSRFPVGSATLPRLVANELRRP
jgi:hypothetical protein